ncbi:hypothetical protein H5T51_06360, partial [Candidatus Bathyarchaeota archaeon]|nr:hypothetical protein [Candidatus Bathyarchaeota archaeon]
MTKSEIRLQYSGFVIFAAKLLSIATGLAFQLMIARTVTPEEYGIWFNLNDILTYFALFAGVIPFWAMRFASRGARGAIKTGLLTNLFFSVIATVLYIITVKSTALTLGVQEYFFVYIIGSFQIIEYYLISASEEFLRARKPEIIGYGLLISELFKVALGYFIIIIYGKPLEGAIASIILAIATQLIYYLMTLKVELRGKLKLDYVKEWIKGSILNVYTIVGAQIANFVLILLFIYGGERARGYYGAASQIAT